MRSTSEQANELVVEHRGRARTRLWLVGMASASLGAAGMFAATSLLTDDRDERPGSEVEGSLSVQRDCQLRVVVEEGAPQLGLSSVVRRIERAKGTNVRPSPDNIGRVFEAIVSIDDVATALRAVSQADFVTDASITSCE